MSEVITKEEIKERELARIFQAIEEEIDLIKASAKFNHAIDKTHQKETALVLAYSDDTEKIVQALKKRMCLLWEITG